MRATLQATPCDNFAKKDSQFTAGHHLHGSGLRRAVNGHHQHRQILATDSRNG